MNDSEYLFLHGKNKKEMRVMLQMLTLGRIRIEFGHDGTCQVWAWGKLKKFLSSLVESKQCLKLENK